MSESSTLVLQAARALNQAGRFQEALQVLALMPVASAPALVERGVAQHAMGYGEQALQSVLEALKLRPLEPAFISHLVRIASDCGARDLASRARRWSFQLESSVGTLLEALDAPLGILDLGSAGSSMIDWVPSWLAPRLWLLSVDASTQPMTPEGEAIPAKVFQGILAAERGPQKLIVRANDCASSLLEPDARQITAFGLEAFYAPIRAVVGEGRLLQDILEPDIPVSLYKSDLEGLDFGVFQSLGPRRDEIHWVKMELRFLPFFQGEPFLDEVIAAFRAQGLEVIHCAADQWRYATPHRDHVPKGRSVYADVVFGRNPSWFLARGANREGVRAVLTARLLGHENYAEFLLESLKDAMDPDLRQALSDYLFLDRAFWGPQHGRDTFPHLAFA